MELASSAVKRVQLELGGKAPFIVLDDADLDAAIEGAVFGGLFNLGQDCVQASRFYIHESLYKKFIDGLVNKVEKLKLGDPLDRNTDLGPLVSKAQRDRIANYVRIGLEEGAKLATGGKIPDLPLPFSNGYFYQPTVFYDAEQYMRIAREEIFGPVLTVMPFRTDEEAIQKSNDTIYGLAASVWTRNIARAMKFAKELRFGSVWVNEHDIFLSEAPHGGYKQSGFGKDLSVFTLHDYTQIKNVYIDITGKARKPWYYWVSGE